MAFGSPISLKLVASGILTQAKYRISQLESEYALGEYYDVSLGLGLSETTSDIITGDAICSVSKAKRIVKTALVGLSGTIKEYICDDDFEITIEAGLVTEGFRAGSIADVYPEDEIKALRDLLEQNKEVYVKSDFLQLFDITRIVITDFSLQQMTYGNYQTITIKALSDRDYTINSNEY